MSLVNVKFIAKLQNLNVWQILEICNFDFVLLWHGIWYESIHVVWVTMGRRGYSQNTGALVVLVEFWMNYYWWDDNIQNDGWDPPSSFSILNTITDAVTAELAQINTLRSRQNGCHFAYDKAIFLNENCCILIQTSLKFVSNGPTNNNPALVQIVAWCQTGDKPLYELMMTWLLMQICTTWPQWVISS